MVRALALLPFIAMLVGPFFLNRVTPTIFGMPFLLAWFVAWILISAAIMAVIFRLDPANRDDPS
jgi:tellurite resistance protein TehA-like permease